MSRKRLARSLVVAVAVGMAGCGGSSQHGKAAGKSPPASGRVSPHAARAADVKVIRAWVDTLRAGHVAAAARYFALPAVVQNNTPPIRLRTRQQARLFNKSLPCGARLERTFAAGRFVAATFVLTDRPGGNCGNGKGHLAATAFVIRAGKIVEWRRVPLPSETPSPEAPPAPRQRS